MKKRPMVRTASITEMTEEELFVEYRKGNDAAMEMLLEKMGKPLFRTILRQVGDREAAQDVFQETLKRMVKHAGKYDPEKPLRGWVWTIAARLGVDHIRKNGRYIGMENPERLDAGNQNPENEAIAAQSLRNISKALSRLEPAQREVFLMREEAGLSFAQISQVTGRPMGTVLTRMHTALKKLRNALEED